VVGVNRIGDEPMLNYAGDSAIVDYRGISIAECEERECVSYAELDIDKLNSFKIKFNVSADADEFEMKYNH
jgi:predicted amidohydrolase